ncbi:MAG: ExbD/TolR family protein [Bacteroidota bacterium]|jgi:biopolymer transport protein ExbD
MAELNTDDGGGGGKHGGKVKAKKSSTKIDMTPMVDLAFLLLTFFMLTTTFSKPQAMEINMPVKDKVEDPPKIPGNQTLTLLLSDKNRIYYYMGADDPNLPPTVEYTTFANNGIRKLLIDKNKEINKTYDKVEALKKEFLDGKIDEKKYKVEKNKVVGDKKALIVLIKADEQSNYKNLVDILDEMSICNIGRYAIVDITASETEMIKNVVVQ